MICLARFCSSCGAPLNDGAKFCGKCGQKVQSEPTPAQPIRNPAPQPNYNPPPSQPRNDEFAKIREMFFSLNGRIDRMNYFKRTLIVNGIGFVLIILISIMFVTPFGIVTPTGNNLINIVALAMLIPKFFLDVRRLKDIGSLPFSTLNSEKQTLITAGVYALWSMSFIFMSSGRRYSDFFIPFIGTLIIWGWMQFKRGTVGPNSFGEDPLG